MFCFQTTKSNHVDYEASTRVGKLWCGKTLALFIHSCLLSQLIIQRMYRHGQTSCTGREYLLLHMIKMLTKLEFDILEQQCNRGVFCQKLLLCKFINMFGRHTQKNFVMMTIQEITNIDQISR